MDIEKLHKLGWPKISNDCAWDSLLKHTYSPNYCNDKAADRLYARKGTYQDLEKDAQDYGRIRYQWEKQSSKYQDSCLNGFLFSAATYCFKKISGNTSQEGEITSSSVAFFIGAGIAALGIGAYCALKGLHDRSFSQQAVASKNEIQESLGRIKLSNIKQLKVYNTEKERLKFALKAWYSQESESVSQMTLYHNLLNEDTKAKITLFNEQLKKTAQENHNIVVKHEMKNIKQHLIKYKASAEKAGLTSVFINPITETMKFNNNDDDAHYYYYNRQLQCLMKNNFAFLRSIGINDSNSEQEHHLYIGLPVAKYQQIQLDDIISG